MIRTVKVLNPSMTRKFPTSEHDLVNQILRNMDFYSFTLPLNAFKNCALRNRPFPR
jgi:hypothetical protein